MLKEKYKKEAIPAMTKKFGYKNKMAVPKLEKVSINTGFGRQVADKTTDEQKKIRESIANDIALISGQKPVFTNATKSIPEFKVRKGVPIGAKVTLRRKMMYDFLERFVNIALPRSRDFKGIDLRCFDQRGNLAFGVKEHIIFPEVSPEKTRGIFGLEISVVTTAKTKEEGIELFRLLGFPIKKD